MLFFCGRKGRGVSLARGLGNICSVSVHRGQIFNRTKPIFGGQQ